MYFDNNKCHIKINIFEGPLDLLLHLINKNKIDITDIPIEIITRQYLEYLSLMQQMDIAIAGEYLLMAATLMHIKSKMLLPKTYAIESIEEDPRMEIVRPLKELIEYKNLAKYLYEQPILGEKVWTTPYGLNDFLEDINKNKGDSEISYLNQERPIEISIDNLFNAYLKVLERNRVYPIIQVNTKERLFERMSYILDLLYSKGVLRFFEIISDYNRYTIIISFLAILELSKSEKIRLIQEISVDEDLPEIQIFLSAN